MARQLLLCFSICLLPAWTNPNGKFTVKGHTHRRHVASKSWSTRVQATKSRPALNSENRPMKWKNRLYRWNQAHPPYTSQRVTKVNEGSSPKVINLIRGRGYGASLWNGGCISHKWHPSNPIRSLTLKPSAKSVTDAPDTGLLAVREIEQGLHCRKTH